MAVHFVTLSEAKNLYLNNLANFYIICIFLCYSERTCEWRISALTTKHFCKAYFSLSFWPKWRISALTTLQFLYHLHFFLSLWAQRRVSALKMKPSVKWLRLSTAESLCL